MTGKLENKETVCNRQHDKITCVLICICLFLLLFLMQLKFLNAEYFISDEEDMMLGGKSIVKGFLLYKDYFSQHMPTGYYISALFELLGARTITLQRIYYYVFFAFMWTFMYKRYRVYVAGKVLILYPIMFLSIIGTYQYGTTILSENIAGIGLMLLFLEFIKFTNLRELDWKSCALISLSVILSFGALFIAIYPLFFIGLCVFAQEIVWAWEKRNKIDSFLKNFFKRYMPLAVWVGIPWLIYFIYLKVTGTLYLFYYSAYVINRTIYPQYLEDGLGGSIVGSFLNLPAMFSQTLQSLLFPDEGFTYAVAVQLIVLLLAILFVIWVFYKRKRLFGVTLVLFTLACGIREYFGYHGTHCEEILCFCAAGAVCTIYREARNDIWEFWHQAVFILPVIIVIGAYTSDLGSFDSLEFKENTSTTSLQIAATTDEDEGVWNFTLSNDILMQADRASVYSGLICPWGSEAFEAYILSEVEKDLPRVVLLNKDLTVWGYDIKVYDAAALEYIDANYTQYGDSWVYICNDYYLEAVTKLEEAGL